MTWDGSKWSAAGTTANDIQANAGGADKIFDKKVKNFFDAITKIKKANIAIKGGTCIAVATAQDTTYTGTFPAGIVTTDTYSTYSDKVGDALKQAIYAAGGGVKDASNGTFAEPTGSDAADYKALANGAATAGKKSTTK